MAKLLKNLLSGNAGKLVESVGGVLDNLITSDEERKEAKIKLKQLILDHETKAQEQVTARWEADMKSDNWLSKNIRPVVLIFLTAVFVLMSFFDGNLGEFTINDAYKPIYQTLLITVYGAYFAGRTIEKARK